ncbi:MAG: CvpA family protein [Burkholderiaceae bacterium]
MGFNWIDIFLGAVILAGIWAGWRHGFLSESLDLLGWAGSLVLGMGFYQPVAQWLASLFTLSPTWSKPLAFLLVFLISSLALRRLAGKLLMRIPGTAQQHSFNKALGILPGLVDGLIYAVIFSALLMSLPLPASLQGQALDSEIANEFASYAETIEARLRPVFDEAISETLTMRTVRPQSKDTIKLPFTMAQSRPRPELEKQMLALLNKERAAQGLKPVALDGKLTGAARNHSADMLARGYFSHYSPEGKDAFDRLRSQKISFLVAGENLAFAPTVKIAHTGLMNSPGHRANILRPVFGKVGIGIMDAGRRGIMVTQKFSN